MLASVPCADPEEAPARVHPSTAWPPREDPRSRAVGLVHHHISAQTDSTSVVVCPNGIILKTHQSPPAVVVRGDRGIVVAWSAASRRRYRESVVRLPMIAYQYEIAHLTYPGTWSHDWRRWKRDLHRLELALVRDWPDLYIGLLWVLEIQRRGAPHYHAFIQLRQSPGRLFPKWLSRTWYRVVGSDDPRHLAAGTRCVPLNTHLPGGLRRAALYLAKYTGKSEQKTLIDQATGQVVPIGRMWGKSRGLVLSELATFRITDKQRVLFSRAIRRWGHRSSYQSKVGKAFKGCLIYGDPSSFRQLLRVIIPEAELAEAFSQPRGP